MTRTYHANPAFQLRLVAEKDVALGPGKADLLEAIARTGSISAASRELEMSYKKAWQLIVTMNQCFSEPLVSTESGGHEHGGAQLTALGEKVLAHYRQLEALLDPAQSADAQALIELLAPPNQ